MSLKQMYNMNSKHQKNSKLNSIFGLVNHDVKNHCYFKNFNY